MIMLTVYHCDDADKKSSRISLKKIACYPLVFICRQCIHLQAKGAPPKQRSGWWFYWSKWTAFFPSSQSQTPI